MTTAIDAVLIANRGEIALRIARTLRRMGIRPVAVHTDADAGAPHVAGIGDAVRIGSYLSVDDVVAAATAAGADAVHPGYGFLSERAELAAAVEAAGLTWIGPPAAAIAAMGDKIRAKATVAAAGVPVVPGASDTADHDDAALAAAALDVGLPVLLKPSAGGGGKGMHRVTDAAALPDAIAAARREARAGFGDDTLLVERWVTTPRHIELQVLADAHGHAVHLGERECSLQRRHQKVVEEAPSALLDDATRSAMGEAAVAAARAVGYVGAGTVECIVSADRPGEWFFMEMNTRLQVEHPVTEAVTGLDLVELQVRVAAGERLPLTQGDVHLTGHAVEARVYAEDPGRGFLPSAGRVLALDEPVGEGIRVDSGLAPGAVVGTGFDPMLGKVVAWGPDRAAALGRLREALAATAVLGVTTNTGLLTRLVARPEVLAGTLDTELLDRIGAGIAAPAPEATAGALVAAALVLALGLEPAAAVAAPGTPGDRRSPPAAPAASSPAAGGGLRPATAATSPWDVPGGWRLGPAAPANWAVRVDGHAATLSVTGRAADASVSVDAPWLEGAAPAGPVRASATWLDPTHVLVATASVSQRWAVAVDGDEVWVGAGGDTWRVAPDPAAAAGAEAAAGAGGPVTSPMPGTVLAVHVAPGQAVAAGDRLVTVEAMKMEHVVTAPVAGTVASVAVAAGQPVALDATLAVVTPEDAA